eukprot:364003-Chlamydomonas_euryale.AAC.4
MANTGCSLTWAAWSRAALRQRRCGLSPVTTSATVLPATALTDSEASACAAERVHVRVHVLPNVASNAAVSLPGTSSTSVCFAPTGQEPAPPAVLLPDWPSFLHLRVTERFDAGLSEVTEGAARRVERRVDTCAGGASC